MVTFLRDSTTIVLRATGDPVAAKFISLTPDTAAELIDDAWHAGSHLGTAMKSEDDRAWVWEVLSGLPAKSEFWEASALQTDDGRIQGAILYQTDALSSFELKKGAVYVERLATAPWNRKAVSASPEFSGVGSELLLRAMHHSHLLTYNGRVVLSTLPKATDFYLKRGFLDTGSTSKGLRILELPSGVARSVLIKKGLVSGEANSD